MKLHFHFFDNEAIGSMIIKARLSSVFSHCGVEFEDGSFFHSAMLKGVVREKLSEQPKRPIATVTMEVTEERYMAAYKYATMQLGKGYDYKAIAGFIFAKKWNEENGLFCSEYGRLIFEAAGGAKLHYYNLVTPGQLRLLVDMHNH